MLKLVLQQIGVHRTIILYIMKGTVDQCICDKTQAGHHSRVWCGITYSTWGGVGMEEYDYATSWTAPKLQDTSVVVGWVDGWVGRVDGSGTHGGGGSRVRG